MELTILMPCLNEADTVAGCVRQARRSLESLGVTGEVLIADNGSTDGSPQLAADAGARVVNVSQKGYGSALAGGILAAQGRFVLMGDADGSYDFSVLGPFLDRLRQGFDLVQGCRRPTGGGHIQPGAMPFLHRWLGNPLFTFLGRWWFRTPVHDTNCGLRAFRKDFLLGLDLRCTGMEFANEMLIKASLTGGRIAEVPITLHPDGRRSRTRHLRTFRDGWRTLRFYLLFCPRWLFLVPGALLMLAGLAGGGLLLGRSEWSGHPLRATAAAVASMVLMCGYQSVLFGFLTKAFAINEGLLPMDRPMERFFRIVNLERGLLLGALGLIAGLVLLGLATARWWSAGSTGVADRPTALAIVAATLGVLGFQTILFSFFASLLGMHRR